MADNGFGALRERVARLESEYEHLERNHRDREAHTQTSRRFVLTTSFAAAGLVFTAISVIAALVS